MITVEHISKRFGTKYAVEDVSFHVEEGQNVAIIGTSGSGKTTLLKMINRIIEPSEGDIFINGQSIESQSLVNLRRNIGYVIQQIGLFPHYTIAENIAIVPKLLKWEKGKIEEETRKLMVMVNLDPHTYLAAYPSELSGGQQQRVGLVRALIADPDIILMDEPFGALDPITRKGVRQEFLALEVLQSKTILLVTHDLAEAFELGDKIILMDEGHIKQSGSPIELLFHPRNEFVKAFFQSQLFELQYKVVSIQDILPWLKETSSVDKTAFITAKLSLYESLELLPTLGDVIGIQTSSQTIYTNHLYLLEAFDKLKETYNSHS